ARPCRRACSSGAASDLLSPLPCPAARIQADPSSRVLEGHAVNLTCRVSSGSPALLNFTWYRNGRQLAEASAASLAFQRVASADAGLYYCKATTDGTSRSSAAVSLDVLCECGAGNPGSCRSRDRSL
ncbi:SN protein, partial [Casuarius casuarius]|nr:SN protein [Casuarius casuarius]